MVQLVIRKAGGEDHLAIVVLQTALAWETEGRVLDSAIIEHGVRQILRNAVPGYYLVAESQGQIIGCVMVNPEWSDWSGKMMYWLNSVFVVPQHRKKGVLRALFEQVRS